jgi:hypothetical protein
MRALLIVALLGAPAAAGPKSLPPQIVKAARDAFAAARTADEKGDLDTAAKQYKRAYEISPHPNVLFNLADVYRRMKSYETAIDTYTKYLASDGIADRAAVEALVAQLKAIPGTLEITMEEPDGIVFVDGKRIGKLPRTVEVSAGTHVVDGITPITHGYGICSVQAGGSSRCDIRATPREDGNLILSGRWPMGGLSWGVPHADGERVRLRFRGRSVAKPGHYPDLGLQDRTCKPVPLDVPAGGVVFAWVTYPDREGSSRDCDAMTITVQRVTF